MIVKIYLPSYSEADVWIASKVIDFHERGRRDILHFFKSIKLIFIVNKNHILRM